MLIAFLSALLLAPTTSPATQPQINPSAARTIADLKAQVAALKRELNQLRDELTKIRTDRDALRSKLDSLEEPGGDDKIATGMRNGNLVVGMSFEQAKLTLENVRIWSEPKLIGESDIEGTTYEWTRLTPDGHRIQETIQASFKDGKLTWFQKG